jgi:hypothetical protein
LTQTLPRTLIEQEGFQGVLSDGGGRKYQLKKKRRKMVTFCRRQLQNSALFWIKSFDQAVVNWLFFGTNKSPAFFV